MKIEKLGIDRAKEIKIYFYHYYFLLISTIIVLSAQLFPIYYDAFDYNPSQFVANIPSFIKDLFYLFNYLGLGLTIILLFFMSIILFLSYIREYSRIYCINLTQIVKKTRKLKII